MPPLPKKKTSSSRKRRRRSHLSVSVPHLIVCPQCRSPKPNHRVCPVCGTYNGRDILAVGRERKAPPPTP